MTIIEAASRPDGLIKNLCGVWEKSVRATHLFLTEEDIQMISQYVPSSLRDIPHLLICLNEDAEPMAFLGADGQKMEMLFVLPQARGRCIGKNLLLYAQEKYDVREVCVNEQNLDALGFYEHMGFTVYKRTDYDEQGNPFPLLYLKLKQYYSFNKNDLHRNTLKKLPAEKRSIFIDASKQKNLSHTWCNRLF